MRKRYLTRASRALPALLLLLGAGCSSDIGLPAPAELTATQVGFGARGTVELRWQLVVRADRYVIGYDTDGAAPWDGRGLSLVQFPEGCGDFDLGAGGTADAGGVRTRAANEAGTSADGGGAADGGGGGDAAADAAGDATGGGDGSAGADGGGSGDGSGSADATAKPDSASPRDAAAPDVLGPGRAADSPVTIPAVWCLETADTFTDLGVVPVRTPGKRPTVRLQNLEVGKTYTFAVRVERRDATSEFSKPVSVTVTARKP